MLKSYSSTRGSARKLCHDEIPCSIAECVEGKNSKAEQRLSMISLSFCLDSSQASFLVYKKLIDISEMENLWNIYLNAMPCYHADKE